MSLDNAHRRTGLVGKVFRGAGANTNRSIYLPDAIKHHNARHLPSRQEEHLLDQVGFFRRTDGFGGFGREPGFRTLLRNAFGLEQLRCFFGPQKYFNIFAHDVPPIRLRAAKTLLDREEVFLSTLHCVPFRAEIKDAV